VGGGAPARVPSRLNAHYQIALRLADVVLAAISVEAGDGRSVGNAFVVDMPTLFGDFLTAAIDEAILGGHGGAVVRQSPQPTRGHPASLSTCGFDDFIATSLRGTRRNPQLQQVG
jgi:hypothetical protein